MSRLNAHFTNMSEARKALKTLVDMGYSNAHLDLAGTFDYEYSAEINAVGTDNAPSLSALVLRSGGFVFDPSKSPLMAARPSVSGVASTDDSSEISTRLSVNVEEANEGEVSNIIKENGGRIFTTFIE